MFSRKFIKATETYATYEAPVSAPYLRKTFTVTDPAAPASLTVTCTGFYRVFINGTEMTSSRLAPGIVNPDETLFYDAYDITPYLKKGRNVAAFWLGNGMSNSVGGFVWFFEEALFRSAPKLAFALETETGTVEADSSVLCADSPIFFDDLRSGEFYDANKEIPGWNMPDFDDSGWRPAIASETPRGEAMLSEANPVKVIFEEKAEKIIPGRIRFRSLKDLRDNALELSSHTFYKPDVNEEGFVYCFRDNRSCVPRLRINGRPGQKIVIQAAEYCEDNGNLDFAAIQVFYPFGFAQRDVYICKGGEEEYVPSFTYHGARYLMILGADESQIKDDTLTMLVMNSDLKDRGGFTCSDRIANALNRAGHNSDLSNFVWFPTDCPHREKNGWTGDAAMSAEHMLQTIAPEKSWKQWLKQIAASQKPNGMIPGIVPTAGWGYEWGNGPTWDQVMIELPYRTYLYRGDLTLFDEVSDTLFRYLNYASGKRDEYGLVHYGLGDWCHALRNEPLCPLEVSDTAVVYRICTDTALLYRKTGRILQAEFAEKLADELRAAFRRYLIDFGTMTVRGNCQTAQAAGLYYGMFDAGEAPEAYRRLVSLIHEADDHIDCGMIGVRIMFRVLAQHGDADLAWKLITRTDTPGYGVWIEKYGFTSLPETFDPEYHGSGHSLNHHFMGDITGFFIAHIAGLIVNPYGDDPARVRVTPGFVNGLASASAWYDTVVGKISVSWKREGDTAELTIEAADGVHGDIMLPDGWTFDENSRLMPLRSGTCRLIRK